VYLRTLVSDVLIAEKYEDHQGATQGSSIPNAQVRAESLGFRHVRDVFFDHVTFHL
jgi:hypothetical protein